MDLLQALVEGLADGQGVELCLHRAGEALAETVDLRRTDIGSPMLDLLNGKMELEGTPG